MTYYWLTFAHEAANIRVVLATRLALVLGG